ncbi:hypothetical protein [uncultured Brachyspira sp.]|uniref:hypothetical protein n=1 Tax=uncultured Brachyspira sp. TaxID=221953 RepID=UPI00262C5BFA|nr:hypothetical protein [uncultured Brachyspira sp.]
MKKFVLISLFLMISSLAYSHSLGLGMYIPLGGSIPSFYPESSVDPSVSFSPKTAFEVGVIFQPRVNFNIGDGTHTISLGLDVGWYRDTFKFITADSRNYTHEFDSVMTGLNLEWRPLLFQLGIGGGVKIPFSGKYTEGDSDRKISALSGRFNDVLIPYVRLYTGINIVFVSLSLYVNFDIPYIGVKNNVGSLGYGYMYPGKLGSVDIGAQLGIHLDLFKFGDTERKEVIEI